MDLLQRLFDTLAKAEALLDLPHTDELETSKLVTRVAGEYSQIVYLMNKARTEECAIVNVVEEVRLRLWGGDAQWLNTWDCRE